MTTHRSGHAPHAADLTFELTSARIEDHRAAVAMERLARRGPDPIRRLRGMIGGWFIALGRAISVPPVSSRDAATR